VAHSSPTVDDDLGHDDGGLKRSITGKQLFFYTLGDVLGSGIYVLIGLVALPWAARSGSPSPSASRSLPSPARRTPSW
jgi:hypothetical protein